MRGTAYGVGVGSGDPEDMTLKALRLIRDNNVIAFASAVPTESQAYKIAVQNVPELSEKQLISIYMPMTTDKKILAEYHKKGISLIESFLDKGENVVYLTLGDPTVYCSFGYLHSRLARDGYKAEFVSGVPSFCAAAARAGVTLAENKKSLHIIPAMHDNIDSIDITDNQDTYVFMKSGKKLKDIKSLFCSNNEYKVLALENCGMPAESVYYNVEQIPDISGYCTIVLAVNNEVQ